MRGKTRDANMQTNWPCHARQSNMNHRNVRSRAGKVVIADEKIYHGSCRSAPRNVERCEDSFDLVCTWAGGVANGN